MLARGHKTLVEFQGSLVSVWDVHVDLVFNSSVKLTVQSYVGPVISVKIRKLRRVVVE